MVLGRKLVPVTVGHLILLHRLESPFARGGQITVEDIAQAAFILSDNWHESAANMRSPFRPLMFRIWSFRWRKADWVADCETLQKWIWHREEPLSPLNTANGKPLEAPGCERILLVLTNAGIPVETVLDLPLEDAERLVLTWAEANGQVELNGVNHQALKARADAEYARVHAEWEAMTEEQRRSILGGVMPGGRN